MAWTNSKIFSAFITDALNATEAFDLNADSFKVALYNNSITPDQTVTSANTAYNVGQWATAQEVYDAAEWAAAGQTLDGVTSTFTSNVYKFDASDETSAGTSATLTTYGCLVYDDTRTTPVADQGISFHYFGGVQTVTDGTFSVIWNASGIFNLTL